MERHEVITTFQQLQSCKDIQKLQKPLFDEPWLAFMSTQHASYLLWDTDEGEIGDKLAQHLRRFPDVRPSFEAMRAQADQLETEERQIGNEHLLENLFRIAMMSDDDAYIQQVRDAAAANGMDDLAISLKLISEADRIAPHRIPSLYQDALTRYMPYELLFEHTDHMGDTTSLASLSMKGDDIKDLIFDEFVRLSGEEWFQNLPQDKLKNVWRYCSNRNSDRELNVFLDCFEESDACAEILSELNMRSLEEVFKYQNLDNIKRIMGLLSESGHLEGIIKGSEFDGIMDHAAESGDAQKLDYAFDLTRQYFGDEPDIMSMQIAHALRASCSEARYGFRDGNPDITRRLADYAREIGMGERTVYDLANALEYAYLSKDRQHLEAMVDLLKDIGLFDEVMDHKSPIPEYSRSGDDIIPANLVYMLEHVSRETAAEQLPDECLQSNLVKAARNNDAASAKFIFEYGLEDDGIDDFLDNKNYDRCSAEYLLGAAGPDVTKVLLDIMQDKGKLGEIMERGLSYSYSDMLQNPVMVGLLLDRAIKQGNLESFLGQANRALVGHYIEADIQAFVSHATNKEEHDFLLGKAAGYFCMTGNPGGVINLLKTFPDDQDVINDAIGRYRDIFEQYDHNERNLWQVFGKGDRRWQAVLKQNVPDGNSHHQSPYGFSFKLYKQVVGMCSLAHSIESESSGYENPSRTHAMKLATLFSNDEEVRRYIRLYDERWLDKESKQLVHDVCLFDLPTHGFWDRQHWKSMVMRFGPKMAHFLPMAPKIEQWCSENGQGLPKSINKVREITREIGYPRANENPEFADIAMEFGLDDSAFNRGLEMLAQSSENKVLPNLVINGDDIGVPGIYMRRLDASDPKSLVLGKMTACCQHIGGHGDKCVQHGVKSQYGSFYVWQKQKGDEPNLKHDQVLAQSWVWVGNKGEIVFDSFERKYGEYNGLVAPFIQQFAHEVATSIKDRVSAAIRDAAAKGGEEVAVLKDFSPKHRIKVLLGTGGNTPDDLGWQKVANPATPIDHRGYQDSEKQYAVRPKNRLRSRL